MNTFEELERLMRENKDVLIRLKNGTPKPMKMEKIEIKKERESK